MRYKGQQLRGPKTQILAIPRDSGDLIFEARAVMDDSAFKLLDPMPEPPEKILPGNKRSKDIEHPVYKENLQKWFEKKQLWMILKSLEATTWIEWETIQMDKPETYGNYWDELAEAGLNDIERMLIRNLALEVNSIDNEKMEEARQRFLRDRAAGKDYLSTSPTDEAKSTPSGEPVSDLASSLPA